MDGRNFLYNEVTPPPATCSAPAFTFDLQRFAEVTITEETADGTTTYTVGTKKITKSSEKYVIDSETTQYDSLEVAIVAAANVKFLVTKTSGTGDEATTTTTTTYYNAAEDFSNTNLSDATAIRVYGDVTLTGETSVTTQITVEKTGVTLNLGANTLSINNDKSGIYVKNGASLTVNGTGSIEHTYSEISETEYNNKSTNAERGKYITDVIKKKRLQAAIQVGAGEDNNRSGVGLTIGNGVTVKSNSSALAVGNGSKVNLESGSTVESTYSCGIYVGNYDISKATSGVTYTPASGTGDNKNLNDDIELNISGTVRSAATSNLPALQVSGTLSYNTTTININEGSTIEYANTNSLFGYENDDNKSYGNPDAIYAGGKVALNVNGGTITSGGTGIELRAGNLNVTGGTITSTATSYKVNTTAKASSGGQVYGAAIALSQHTTGQDVTTKVEAGTITGQVALAVETPIAPKQGVNNKIEAEIAGGTFESTAEDVAPIAAKAADKRSTIKITGSTTFIGKLESTVAQTASSGSSNIKIEDGAVVTVAKKNEDDSIEVVETYDSSSLTFTEEGFDTDNNKQTLTYPVNKGNWYKGQIHTNLNTVYFLEQTESNLNAVANAKLAPVVTSGSGSTALLSATDLLFTVENGLTQNSLTIDMTNEVFGGLSSTFTLLDASNVTKDDVKLNITGNEYLKKIIGGAGNDTLTAGSIGVSLHGGAGNDLLNGGDGADTFIFTAGADSITGYKHVTDIVSLGADLTAPIDFTNATFDSNKLFLNFGSNNTLTFQSTKQASLKKGEDTYSYKANSGGMEYIAQEGEGISLGAGYTSNFNGTIAANENYKTINAANITKAIQIRGNDKANYMVGGSIGGALLGGDNNDTIIAGGGSTTLRGELGNDVLKGGSGKDTFYYSEGTDSIGGYSASDGDLIISSFNLTEATVSKGTSNNDLILNFGSDALSIAGGAAANDSSAISIQGGNNANNIYTFTKDYVAHNKGITLASDYSETFNGANYSNYATINAAEVKSAISIVGNDNNNYIIGSYKGGSLSGGANNDKLDVLDREANAKYLFQYTAGKDEVLGFSSANDTVDIAPTSITAGKAGNGRLTFTIDKSQSFILRSDDDIAKVSLNGGGYLTEAGHVNDTNFKLFSNAKGRIELTNELYSGASISSLNAESVKDQSITLVGGTQSGAFYYNGTNKQRDGFEYGGGNVTISGYEGGRDKIDLVAASLAGFEIANGGVKLNLGGSSSISIAGAAGEEILLHDENKGRTYQKMVFVETGVVENKKKNPTAATVSASYNFADTSSVKKIYVEGNTSAVSIQAGDKNNTIIDASKAGAAVSLSGGKKNDKLIGGAGDDLFIYTGGKDIINGYTSSDSISLASDLEDSLESAKITAGNKSIKFKFSNKNTLTIKGEDFSSLNVNGKERTYAKNAIADSSGKNVTLTNQFSGTFDTKGTVTYVDGSKVKKNLTFKGTDAAETLIGGGKKNMFKGGGGADSLVGGTGATDTFFYAKSDTGNATIAKFEYGKDKLKVASGKISSISADKDKNVTFRMADGSFKVENTNLESGKNIAIRANNTYYWFADGTETLDSGEAIAEGALITSADKRITAGEVSGFAVIDLNYSTNLAKTNVAFKVTGATPNKTAT